jgi:TetR/AcrR family transcriptional regulator
MKKQRARTSEEMAARKQSIVSALKQLLHRQLKKGKTVSLPSVDRIACEAGVTKGVIYHYFTTKEEICLTLLSQETEYLIDETAKLLSTGIFDIAKLRKKFVEICCSDLFMSLAAMGPVYLEKNVSLEFGREYKLSSMRAVNRLAELWHERDASLSVAELRRFLLRLYIFATALWGHFHPPQIIQDGLAGVKAPWFYEGTFEDSLEETFNWMWFGISRLTS